MPPYILIPDPFPGKGPLPANAPDFYERDELFTNVQNLLDAGDSVSLVGERKAGKTSFLKYLLTQLSSEKFIPVFVDAQGVAPKTDKVFLGRLVRNAANTIERITPTKKPIKIKTLTAESDETVYQAFEDDLETLRAILPAHTNEKKRRLVWLIDEIETLRGYENTELFTFLRPLAQTDPDFRMVVAGYDVLYTLSSRSEWSPFFNAFRHLRLEGLNPVVAKKLIEDAVIGMGVTIEPNLDEALLEWTGQKPFFLKWILSKLAEALNQQKIDHHINAGVLEAAQMLFLGEHELLLHFAHLWNTHTTDSQQKVLSLVAAQTGPYHQPKILDHLKEKKLIEGDKQASQHLIDDLTRLNQLGFLYERIGSYTFTSSCLQAWIKENKPLL